MVFSQDFLLTASMSCWPMAHSLYSSAHPVDRLAGYLTEEWAQKLKLCVFRCDGCTGWSCKVLLERCFARWLQYFRDIECLDDSPAGGPGRRKFRNLWCGLQFHSARFLGNRGGRQAGDLFRWWVDDVLNSSDSSQAHFELSKQSERSAARESGSLALDWNHGNRCLLCRSPSLA